MNTQIQSFKKKFAAIVLVIFCGACTYSPKQDQSDLQNQSDLQDGSGLNGVWLWPQQEPSDSRWLLEDLVCKGLCTKAALEYVREWLDQPENDDKPLTSIFDELNAYHKEDILKILTPSAKASLSGYNPENDPAVDCNPDGDGWLHQIQAPVLFKIEQFSDRVVISYEYWNAVRTIYTDGRKLAQDLEPTRLGHSIGRYEGSTLVVETTGILPAVTLIHPIPPGMFLTHSDQLRTIERYTPSEDGNRLDLEWSMIDPENFSQPLEGVGSALLSGETALEEYVCDSEEAAEVY